jgi:hypothetical protein
VLVYLIFSAPVFFSNRFAAYSAVKLRLRVGMPLVIVPPRLLKTTPARDVAGQTFNNQEGRQMADDRNNPNEGRNAGTNAGDQGGQDRRAPGRNPNEDQSTGQRSDKGGQGGKDQGLGKGQQGNRDLNEGGFEKGGQGGGQGRQNQ